jgi:hypothetical protein
MLGRNSFITAKQFLPYFSNILVVFSTITLIYRIVAFKDHKNKFSRVEILTYMLNHALHILKKAP